MKNVWKIAIVVVLAAAVAATLAMRGAKRAEHAASAVQAPAQTAASAVTAAPTSPVAAPERQTAAASSRPRILELGSMRCQTCLEMAKVLDALRASRGAKLQVDFIDVYEQPEAGDRYRISLIPTQILYDAAGKEIFRHQGYYSHDDVLAKFRDLGVKL